MNDPQESDVSVDAVAEANREAIARGRDELARLQALSRHAASLLDGRPSGEPLSLEAIQLQNGVGF